MENFRICKKCLLRDMEESEYFESVSEYIALLPKADKAPQELYERRLGLCRECEKLVNGICSSCGCFVEMRAALTKNYCPGENHKW